MSFLILGTVAYDVIHTPKRNLNNRLLGGSATYIALAARNFTKKKISIISVIGNDFKKTHIDFFENKQIDLSAITTKNIPTFYWKGKYHKNLNNRDTLEVNIDILNNYEPIVPESLMSSSFLILGNFSPKTQLSVIEQCKGHHFIITDTMDLWINTSRTELDKVIKNTHILCINDSEAFLLSGEDNILKAAKAIIKMGVDNLIIKRGEHGSILFNKDKYFYCPPILLDNVEDPTGAGDCFLGGFSAILSEHNKYSFENMCKSMYGANVIASFCCKGIGTTSINNISKNDINYKLNSLKNYQSYE